MAEEPKKPALIKLTVEVQDVTRRALASYAGLNNLSIGQAIDRAAVLLTPEQIEAARQAISKGEPPPASKRGRKPRS